MVFFHTRFLQPKLQWPISAKHIDKSQKNMHQAPNTDKSGEKSQKMQQQNQIHNTKSEHIIMNGSGNVIGADWTHDMTITRSVIYCSFLSKN